jgi:hypothetical protein
MGSSLVISSFDSVFRVKLALRQHARDAADPSWRARALSVYRFWRDLGYAIGALGAGLLAAIMGLTWTIAAIGALTFVSGVVVAGLMREQPR